MTTPTLQQPLRTLHKALRDGTHTAVEITESALQAYQIRGEQDHAYKTWSGDAALAYAQATDAILQQGGDAGRLMGMPVSVKDIYAVPGFPTFAGSSRRLPPDWETPGPVISTLLNQLPVVMGKTHTVEFAFGGLGTNAHHGAPRNPWDPAAHRTPGGSSAGAGVSLASGTAGRR
ncbi:MAG: hypothetical protein LC677_15905 [Halomonas sp.]|nr:hypothetical protein [Halomonas sp.]